MVPCLLPSNRSTLALTLVVVAVTGAPLFEILSPIGIISRAIVFYSLLPLLLIAAILLLELLVAGRVWCRSSAAGGFYSLLGRFSPLRVGFARSVVHTVTIVWLSVRYKRFWNLHWRRMHHRWLPEIVPAAWPAWMSARPRHLPLKLVIMMDYPHTARRFLMKRIVQLVTTLGVVAALALFAPVFANEQPEPDLARMQHRVAVFPRLSPIS